MYKLYNISKNKFITKNNLNNIICLKFCVIDFDSVIIFNNKDVFYTDKKYAKFICDKLKLKLNFSCTKDLRFYSLC